MQGVVERALVLHPARRPQPGSLLHVQVERVEGGEAAGGWNRGLRVGQAWAVRGEGGVPAGRLPYASDQRGRPEAAGAGAGEGPLAQRWPVRSGTEASGAPLRQHHRGGDVSRWRGAQGRGDGHPEAVALRQGPAGRGTGSGRRRGRGAGARAQAGEPDSRPRSLYRGPGRWGARGPRRLQ